MALTQQSSQLFARVFGRPPESSQESSFLKGVEERKGVGTPASLGAIQFAKQQGSFGGFSQGEGSIPPEPETVDVMSQGMDKLKKKMIEIDQKEKKLFRAEQQFEVKKTILSDPSFKKLLDTKSGLRKMLNEKNFSEDIPVTPGVTNPLDVSRAAIGQQQGMGDFIRNAATVADTTNESITTILSKLGQQRQDDVDNARNSFKDLLELQKEGRDQELHPLHVQKLKTEIEQMGSLTPAQRLSAAQGLIELGYDSNDVNDVIDKLAGGFTPGSNGMRTDRHNNPAAFTTDIAKQAGLVLGRDYEIGDPFPNNPSLKTARLLGDPIAQTIKVIDKIGFTTQGGKNRWTYTNSIPGANDYDWPKLTQAQKVQIISKMYQNEGGNGSLLAGGARSSVASMIGPSATAGISIPPEFLNTATGTPDTIEGRRQANLAAKDLDKPLSTEDLIKYGKPAGTTYRQIQGAQPQSAAQQEKSSAIENAKGFVTRLEQASIMVNTSPSLTAQLKAKAGAAFNKTDANIAELEALQITSTLIARSLGEKGVISDGDIKRIGKSIPKWYDSKVTAAAKIKTIKDILAIAEKTKPGTYKNVYSDDDALMDSTSDLVE